MKDKKDVYSIITESVLKQMDNGIIPWDKPWNGGIDCAVSYATGKPYSLANQMLISKTGQFLTKSQVDSLGGKVKKGTYKEIATFYKMASYREFLKGNGGQMQSQNRTIPNIRFYFIYPLDGCEGLEPRESEVVSPIDADKIISDYIEREGLKVEESVNFQYELKKDTLFLPKTIKEEDYPWIFRQLIHSTGLRLGRDMGIRFGEAKFGKEELIGEMGAAFLCHRAGMSIKRDEQYRKDWMRPLRADKRIFISAATKAEKAVRHILTGEIRGCSSRS
jgi:antirestriction protein ArdC